MQARKKKRALFFNWASLLLKRRHYESRHGTATLANDKEAHTNTLEGREKENGMRRAGRWGQSSQSTRHAMYNRERKVGSVVCLFV